MLTRVSSTYAATRHSVSPAARDLSVLAARAMTRRKCAANVPPSPLSSSASTAHARCASGECHDVRSNVGEAHDDGATTAGTATTSTSVPSCPDVALPMPTPPCHGDCSSSGDDSSCSSRSSCSRSGGSRRCSRGSASPPMRLRRMHGKSSATLSATQTPRDIAPASFAVTCTATTPAAAEQTSTRSATDDAHTHAAAATASATTTAWDAHNAAALLPFASEPLTHMHDDAPSDHGDEGERRVDGGGTAGAVVDVADMATATATSAPNVAAASTVAVTTTTTTKDTAATAAAPATGECSRGSGGMTATVNSAASLGAVSPPALVRVVRGDRRAGAMSMTLRNATSMTGAELTAAAPAHTEHTHDTMTTDAAATAGSSIAATATAAAAAAAAVTAQALTPEEARDVRVRARRYASAMLLTRPLLDSLMSLSRRCQSARNSLVGACGGDGSGSATTAMATTVTHAAMIPGLCCSGGGGGGGARYGGAAGGRGGGGMYVTTSITAAAAATTAAAVMREVVTSRFACTQGGSSDSRHGSFVRSLLYEDAHARQRSVQQAPYAATMSRFGIGSGAGCGGDRHDDNTTASMLTRNAPGGRSSLTLTSLSSSIVRGSSGGSTDNTGGKALRVRRAHVELDLSLEMLRSVSSGQLSCLDDCIRTQLYVLFARPPSAQLGSSKDACLLYEILRHAYDNGDTLTWEAIVSLLLPSDQVRYRDLYAPMHCLDMAEFVAFIELASIRCT